MNDEKRKPLISIIVPVYNGQAFLAPFIDSVIASSYDNWQMIMVDDGSTDDSRKIISSYQQKDERIMLIESEHVNAGNCRNIGIDNSQGEYLCFFDCDDLVMPTFLQDMLDALQSNDGDLAFCKSNAFLQDSGTYKDMNWSFRTRFFPKTDDGTFNRSNCGDNLFQSNLIAPWNKMVKAQLVKDNNIRAQSIASANDVVLTCLMMSQANRIVPVNKVLYTQRRNNHSSITANLGNKNFNCGYQASAKLHDELVKRGLYEQVKISYQKLAVHNCIWYLQKIENEPGLMKQQFAFLKNRGFAALETDSIDEKAARGFLDKNELEKYRALMSLDYVDYCRKYNLKTVDDGIRGYLRKLIRRIMKVVEQEKDV